MRGFLPDAIIAKKKQGFGLPFGVWVGRHAGLRRLALESLDSLATRGIVLMRSEGAAVVVVALDLDGKPHCVFQPIVDAISG